MPTIAPAIKQIAFVEADKYIVAKPYYGLAPFKPPQTFKTSYGTFYETGEYSINAGFLFSANFPAINSPNTMRASCHHDFVYNLIKDGLLPRNPYREHADRWLHDILIEDGIIQFRAFAWYKAVQIGGDAALNSPAPKIRFSPVEIKLQENPRKGLI